MTSNQEFLRAHKKECLKRPDYGTSSRSSSSNKPSSSTPTLRPNVRRRFPKALKEDIASGPLSHLQQWINPLSKLQSILQNKACLKGPASRKNIQLQALSLWKPLFAGLGQLPLTISSAMAPNRGRQAAKITGAGNGTGGRDARKRKNQSIRFLRRLIPILLSGSPLGSANMHSKRTFRLVVFAARAPIGTTGGSLLRGVRKCDTRSYELSLFTAWVPVRSPESDARNDFRSLQAT